MRKFLLILPVLLLTIGITSAQSIALTQSYSDANVTFAYPAGWVVGSVSDEVVEIGSSIRALDAPTTGLDRGEVYIRMLVRVGSLASARPNQYLEELSSQATRNQAYEEIDTIRINGREAAVVIRDDLDRSVQRIIGIIDMGNGRIGGMLATIAQGEVDLHLNNVLAIMATLSDTTAAQTGFWTHVDEFIRFQYPFEWDVARVNDDVINVKNTTEGFLGLPGQVLVQVVTFDLFAVDVAYEQIILSIESEQPTYQIGELVPTTVGAEAGAVVRYTIEEEGIEGIFILFTLFDGRIGLVNLQAASGEIANYVDIVTRIAESVEVPATVLIKGAQLPFDTFAVYETGDENYTLSHPPNWLIQEIPTGLLLSNDLNIADRNISNLRPRTVLMLVYPQLTNLPFPVTIRTPTAITNRFRQASPSIGITQLSETVRTIDEDGLVTSTVFGLHPEYDVWIIAREKPNDQILTSLVYAPRGEMGLHQRQVRTVIENFDYTGVFITDCEITPINVVNARTGPGVAFGVQSSVSAEVASQGIAQEIGADGFIWWQIEGGGWVREDVVTETESCYLLPPPRS